MYNSTNEYVVITQADSVHVNIFLGSCFADGLLAKLTNIPN